MTFEDTQPTSRTILLAEVFGSDIIWTEPRDFEVPTASSPHSRPIISSRHGPKREFFHYTPSGGANVALADGSVHFVSGESLSAERLPELLKVGGFTEADESLPASPRINWPNCFALAVWLLSVVWLQYRAWQGRRQMIREAASGRWAATLP